MSQKNNHTAIRVMNLSLETPITPYERLVEMFKHTTLEVSTPTEETQLSTAADTRSKPPCFYSILDPSPERGIYWFIAFRRQLECQWSRRREFN